MRDVVAATAEGGTRRAGGSRHGGGRGRILCGGRGDVVWVVLWLLRGGRELATNPSSPRLPALTSLKSHSTMLCQELCFIERIYRAQQQLYPLNSANLCTGQPSWHSGHGTRRYETDTGAEKHTIRYDTIRAGCTFLFLQWFESVKEPSFFCFSF